MKNEKLHNAIFISCIAMAVIFALLFIGLNCRFAMDRTSYLYTATSGSSNNEYKSFIQDAKIMSNVFMVVSLAFGGIGCLYKIIYCFMNRNE